MKTGRTIRPAASGEGVRQDPRSFLVAASSLTLPRPGEHRKDTCAAAPGYGRFMSVQGVEVASRFRVVRRRLPAPVLGLMENPAVVRRPFPEPRAGQMETTSHA